ncbi:MAG: translation elongation factor Ts [Candidatus Lernaella stagnicola]|nr:translation elongation factor Ts [Candidatus Lernaella stagnicola]
MAISAAMVKELRGKTGVGMMDCKKALQENDGDMEKAIEWLRKKGLSKAAKRADRATSHGVFGIFVSESGGKIAVVELNCETDFVAKNEDFGKLADQFAAHVAATGTTDAEALKNEKFTADPNVTVGDVLAENLAKIGESIKIGQIIVWETQSDDAKLGIYVHTGASAVGLTELTGTSDKDVAELGKHLGMQIVAARPTYLTPDDVPEEIVAKEIEIYREEARQSGKPENILDKIAQGKLNKFYQDICLIKQTYVKDPQGKQSVEKLLAAEGVGIARFTRLAIG